MPASNAATRQAAWTTSNDARRKRTSKHSTVLAQHANVHSSHTPDPTNIPSQVGRRGITWANTSTPAKRLRTTDPAITAVPPGKGGGRGEGETESSLQVFQHCARSLKSRGRELRICGPFWAICLARLREPTAGGAGRSANGFFWTGRAASRHRTVREVGIGVADNWGRVACGCAHACYTVPLDSSQVLVDHLPLLSQQVFQRLRLLRGTAGCHIGDCCSRVHCCVGH
jgi:hypothetical protein